MLRRIRRLLAMTGAERRLLVRAFAALTVTDVALYTYGFQWLIGRARSAGLPRSHTASAQDLERATAYAHWLEVASRYHLVRVRCLHRSITLHSWLLGEGLPSELKLGVRKHGGELKAHAWVEVAGNIVSDEPGAISRFTPLARRFGMNPSSSSDVAAPSGDAPATPASALRW